MSEQARPVRRQIGKKDNTYRHVACVEVRILAECARRMLMLLIGENLASLDWMAGKQDDRQQVPTNDSVNVSLNKTQLLDVEPVLDVVCPAGWMMSLFVCTTQVV
jgi:hypothetical protein